MWRPTLAAAVLTLVAACGRLEFTARADATDASADTTRLAYFSEVLADQPIDYWRLGEASGVVAVDRAGTNNGAYVNEPMLGQPGALPDDPDTAVYFGGSNDYVNIPDTEALRLDQPGWSIELWAKLTALSANDYPPLLAKGNTGSAATGWLVYYESPSVVYPGISAYAPIFKRANVDLMYASVALSPTQFHYYVATYDGALLRWYVDGNPDTSYSATFPPCTDTSTLLMATDGGNHANLTIDEVAVYPVVLAPARIAAHYAAR